MHVLWKHILPPKKTAQSCFAEGQRPSFVVCWFARLALWSHVRRFCPFPVLSINMSGPSHQGLCTSCSSCGPALPRYLCLASVLSLLEVHDRIPQTGQFKQQTFIFWQAWRRQKHTSRFEPIWFLVRTLCLACRQPSSCYVHAWPFLHATSWPGLTSDMPWKVPSLSTATQGLSGPQHRDLGRTHTFRP